MAPQQRRPVVALRIRVRRRISNFTGIISGSFPVDASQPLPSEHYRRGSASASRSYSNRNSRSHPKRSSTWSSLSSITESDESEEEEREPLVQISSNQSAAGPTNPFSDFYAAAENGNEDGAHSTGLELVRVNNNSERDMTMQVVRHRNPYTITTAAARGTTYQISISKGMKWKSTPGAYALTAPPVKPPLSKVNVPTKNTSTSTNDDNSEDSSATTTTTTTTTTNPQIHEIDWNHHLTGPYASRSLRPANPRTVSRRLSSLAYSHPDSSTMMAMLENSTPACDLMAFGGGPGSLRANEFEALGMMGYDLQWLEYMSIPSGGLGKLKRWVGRRLGVGSSCASGKGTAGSGVGDGGKGALQRPATIGCAAEVKSSMRPNGVAGAGKRVRFSTA